MLYPLICINPVVGCDIWYQSQGLYTPWDPGSHTCLWMPFTCGSEDVQPRQPWLPPRPLELTGNTSLLVGYTACCVFDRGKSGKGEFTRPVLLLGAHTLLALHAEFTGSQDALQFKITSEELQLRPTPWPSFWDYAAAMHFQNSLAGVLVISLTEVPRLSCCSQSAEIYQSVLSHFARHCSRSGCKFIKLPDLYGLHLLSCVTSLEDHICTSYKDPQQSGMVIYRKHCEFFFC